jgi:hypothetical protein
LLKEKKNTAQHRGPSLDDDTGVGRHLHSVPVVPMVTDHKPSECHGNGHLRSTHVDCGDDSAAALGNLLDDFHHHTRRPAVQATRGLICKTCAQPGAHAPRTTHAHHTQETATRVEEQTVCQRKRTQTCERAPARTTHSADKQTESSPKPPRAYAR